MAAGATRPPDEEPEAAQPAPREQEALARDRAPSSEAVLVTAAVKGMAGPLPPPEMMAGYKEALPNAPERIMQMAESQQAHRQALEQAESEHDRALDAEELRLDHRREVSGMRYGLAAVIAALVAAVIIGFLGAPYAAAGVAGFSLAALAGVFVYGRRQGEARGEDRARQDEGRPEDARQPGTGPPSPQEGRDT